MGKADEQECNRGGDSAVDAVLDGREDCDGNSSDPDQELERGNAPEGVDLNTQVSSCLSKSKFVARTWVGGDTKSMTAWMMIAERPALGIQKKASVKP